MPTGEIRINSASARAGLSGLTTRVNMAIVVSNVFGLVEAALNAMSPFSWFSDARYLLNQSKKMTEEVENGVRALIDSIDKSIGAYEECEAALVRLFNEHHVDGSSSQGLPSGIGAVLNNLPHWPGFPVWPSSSNQFFNWFNGGQLSILDVLFLGDVIPGFLNSDGFAVFLDGFLNGADPLYHWDDSVTLFNHLPVLGDVVLSGDASLFQWDGFSSFGGAKAKGDELGVSAGYKGEGTIAKFSADLSTDWSKDSLELYAGKVAIKGDVKAPFSFDKDGNIKFDSKIGLEVEATGDLVGGEVSRRIGTDEFNVHSKVEGSIGHGEVKGVAEISKDRIGFGASAKAATFYGEAKGGFSLFGIKFDAKVKGDALSIGGEWGVLADDHSAQFDIGASLGVGAGVSVSVDWSESTLPSPAEVLTTVGEIGAATGEFIGNAVEEVGNAIGDVGAAIGEGWNSLWSWVK